MNHYAFGSFARWFFEHLGGIRIAAPDFKEVVLSPVFIEQLGDFSAGYKTSRGVISSSWRYDESGKVEYRFSIPSGTAARVRQSNGEYLAYTEGDYTIIY
jgi:alpha-L-rhamnosidase